MSAIIPRFTTCCIASCANPGVRGTSCSICERHFCAVHLSTSHTCVTEVDEEAWASQINQEVSDLLKQVDLDALIQRASSLKGGVSCHFEQGQHIGMGSTMGSANYHGWLKFSDGEKWLVRIPRRGTGDVPDELIDYLVESEHATLEFLRDTKVPGPRSFGYGRRLDPTNKVGVSYLLIEHLPGEPYNPSSATPEQKSRCFEQLAEILIEISKHPLSKIGSLVVGQDSIEVGPVASNRWVALGKYGPFKTGEEYYKSIIDQYLDLISDGQLHHEHMRDAFLYYKMLRQNMLKLSAADRDDGLFFLKHVDDKGDHLLVDPKGNITGIIDWQFARCVPATEAFGPSYFTADLDSLYSARSGITVDDRLLADVLEQKGALKLASHMRAHEVMRRFHHGLGGNGVMKEEVDDLIKGTLVVLGIADTPDGVDLDAWRKEMVDLCERDPRWIELVKLEGAIERS